jgi:isocitrate/isopropylmalate dehydrogenase
LQKILESNFTVARDQRQNLMEIRKFNRLQLTRHAWTKTSSKTSVSQ